MLFLLAYYDLALMYYTPLIVWLRTICRLLYLTKNIKHLNGDSINVLSRVNNFSIQINDSQLSLLKVRQQFISDYDFLPETIVFAT